MKHLIMAALAALPTACGGGDHDPCEPPIGATQALSCAQCIGNDQYPCPPLMPPPAPCGASGCRN